MYKIMLFLGIIIIFGGRQTVSVNRNWKKPNDLPTLERPVVPLVEKHKYYTKLQHTSRERSMAPRGTGTRTTGITGIFFTVMAPNEVTQDNLSVKRTYNIEEETRCGRVSCA